MLDSMQKMCSQPDFIILSNCESSNTQGIMLMSQGMNLYLAAYAVARHLQLVSASESHVFLQIEDPMSMQYIQEMQ